MFRLARIVPRCLRVTPKKLFRPFSAGFKQTPFPEMEELESAFPSFFCVKGFKQSPSSQMEELKRVFKGPGRLISIVPQPGNSVRVDVFDDATVKTAFSFEVDTIVENKHEFYQAMPILRRFTESVNENSRLRFDELATLPTDICVPKKIPKVEDFIGVFDTKQHIHDLVKNSQLLFDTMKKDGMKIQAMDRKISENPLNINAISHTLIYQHLVDMRTFLGSIYNILGKIIISQTGLLNTSTKFGMTHFNFMPFMEDVFSDYVDITKACSFDMTVAHRAIKVDLFHMERLLDVMKQRSLIHSYNEKITLFNITAQWAKYITQMQSS